jgi:hypothetical protein
MKIFRLLILFATLTLISFAFGCNSLRISINETNPPVFRFSAGRLAECCTHLAFLTVSEIPNRERRGDAKIIWQVWPMSGTDNSADGLPPITYGQVPPGFVQKIPTVGPPPPLQEGKIYEASGPPVEVPEAHVMFVIRDGKAIQIPRW